MGIVHFFTYAGIVIIIVMLIESHKKQNKIMVHLGIREEEDDG